MKLLTLIASPVLVLSASSSSQPHPAVQGDSSTALLPQVSGCSPKDDEPDSCPNLLPDGWRSSVDQASIRRVRRMILDMKPENPTPDLEIVRQRRRVSVECRKDAPANESKRMKVVYWRPKGMDDFPVNGSMQRDLVVGIFVSDDDNDCPEYRYGPMKKHGAYERDVQFVTVRARPTVPASASSRDDVVIGEWRSWTIEKDSNGQWRFHELRRGAYVRCGFEHKADTGNIAFITCDDARRLHMAAQDAVNPAAVGGATAVGRAFASLIAQYNEDDAAFRTQYRLESDPFDAPAWGRCGNLGCCASE